MTKYENHSAASSGLDEAALTTAFRSAPHRWVDVGHSRLASWTFGSGPDLVFIHGWPLDSATFRRIVPALSRSFTCHLFDLPGVGQTESRSDAPIDLVSHAESAKAYVDALGLSRYALLAHDSGGFVARLLAAKDRRVTGLVLGDTEIPGHTPALIIAFALLAKTSFAPAVLARVLGSSTLRRSALGFGGCFEDAAYIDGPFFELFVEPLIREPAVARGQMRLLKSLHKDSMRGMIEAHRAIEVPVQLIWGSEDPFFPIEKARAMASQFGGPVSFETIVGAKVFPHEDHAAHFARVSESFLRSLEGRAAAGGAEYAAP